MTTPVGLSIAESSDQMMMGCNVPAGSSDLHDPAVCAHRAPTAWVEEGVSFVLHCCWELVEPPPYRGFRHPSGLLVAQWEIEPAPQEPVKSFLFSPFEENINRDRKRDVLCHDKKNHKFTLETRTRNCLRLDQFGANLGKAVFP